MTVSPNPSTATTISAPTAVTESSAPVVPYGPDLVNWGQDIDKSQVNLPRYVGISESITILLCKNYHVNITW